MDTDQRMSFRFDHRAAQLLDCANFCAHPADRWAPLRTASYMLQLTLSCSFSAATLKMGGLFRVGRLPWAQLGKMPRDFSKAWYISFR
jgi:hypothetical protein